MCQIAAVCTELREKMPDLTIKEQEPMKLHTSFRIGGPCDLMVLPASAEEFAEVLSVLHRCGVQPVILGSGTNVLVSDEGIRGVVVCTKDSLTELDSPEDGVIRAQAGVKMSRLANFAASLGLTGLEFAQGIPGTVGGGVFMNAGAYGGEIRDVAVQTAVFNLDGSEHIYRGEEQAFSYRSSIFQKRDDAVYETIFRLKPGDPEQIHATMKDFAFRRRSKQPLDLPSAGSTFKRPEGHFAGQLIEEAGLKGFRIGDAAVSEKHAGFVVNLGNATCNEVRELIEAVQNRVFECSGIHLETEVRMI